VDHRLADLDAGRVAVDQQAPGLVFEQRHQVAGLGQLSRLANQGGRQLSAERRQRRQ